MIPLSRVKYQPEPTRTYLSGPSLVRLPDGALIVSHDCFGPGCPRNHEGEESLTSIYRSEFDGATWVNVTHIMNCYWSSRSCRTARFSVRGHRSNTGPS